MREITLAQVDHPTALRVDPLVGTTFSLTAIDPPALRKVVDGDPAKGWEGDPRLCWYNDGQAGRLVLMRLENDGQYRTVLVSSQYQIPGDEMANRIIDRLVASDVRRGFDVRAAIDANNAKVDAAKAAAESEHNQAVADKLAFGLKKDLGAHL